MDIDQKTKREYMTSIINQTIVVLGKNWWFSFEERNELKNMIEIFIRKFYMLNPNQNYLKKFLTTKNNHIIEDITRTLNTVLTELIVPEHRETIISPIIKYSKLVVSDFIKLIKDAPEKILVNERSITGFRKTCIDVINLDDAANLHEILKDLDNVIFIQPAEYMRPGKPKPVDFKYLALTFSKKNIKDWLSDIKYCDTDKTNENNKKTPYVLSPLNFNCNPAYIKLWEILHIIHSPQRIFYVLPSPSEGPKHKCEEGNPHEILKIAICDGDDCWKWDENTCRIKASDEEKDNIQTKCHMEAHEEYTRRQKDLESLESLKRKNDHKNPVSKRQTK